MNKFLKNVEIKNFKSVRELKFLAKKVNIFIGKPNVGKSNILEALSLLGAMYETDIQKFLSSFIRYENLIDIYTDQDTSKSIKVKFNNYVSFIVTKSYASSYELFLVNNNGKLDDTAIEKIAGDTSKSIGQIMSNNNIQEYYFTRMERDGRQTFDSNLNTFKKDIVRSYTYSNKLNTFVGNYNAYILPPHGDNLLAVLIKNNELRKEIGKLFDEYSLEFVIKPIERKIELQKKTDGIAYSYSYVNIADTLKRYIFYLTIMESNVDSTILLEEPEVHAFPPYTKMLADRITKDETNQFFITTHSPYLLNTIIENTSVADLNVFVTYYENYETKIKQLTPEELRQVLDDSIDVFFNLDRFLS